MPKPSTPFEAGKMYHGWTHTNGSDNLFRSDENYTFFLDKYKHHVYPVVDTLSYCLMPNHIHFAVRIKNNQAVLKHAKVQKENPTLQGFGNLGGFSQYISQQFSNLFNSYTKSFNKKYDRKGSLFLSNFQRKLVNNDSYFTRLIAYIHNNPVHHRFVDNPVEWRYSSWHAYLRDKKTKINKKEGLAWFGSKEAFRKIHNSINPNNLKSVFEE
jgi:REP element-mobilizing transposase RayT